MNRSDELSGHAEDSTLPRPVVRRKQLAILVHRNNQKHNYNQPSTPEHNNLTNGQINQQINNRNIQDIDYHHVKQPKTQLKPSKLSIQTYVSLLSSSNQTHTTLFLSRSKHPYHPIALLPDKILASNQIN
jgi:hypothetical protein